MFGTNRLVAFGALFQAFVAEQFSADGTFGRVRSYPAECFSACPAPEATFFTHNTVTNITDNCMLKANRFLANRTYGGTCLANKLSANRALRCLFVRDPFAAG